MLNIPENASEEIKRALDFLNKHSYRKGECLERHGGHDSNGYATVPFLNKTIRAHRFVMHALKGMPIDSELHVLHKCDNPGCFEPEHLFSGTNADNIRDSIEKKRRSFRSRVGYRSRVFRCGHPFTEENSYANDKGFKVCRICRLESIRKYNEKRKKK